MLAAMVSSGPSAVPAAASSAALSVSARCYAVGQRVRISGRGFAAAAPYDLSLDGVDFGQSLTDAQGAFATGLSPGGLGSGQAQLPHRLSASDGRTRASATFTVTRPTGALIGSGRGSSPRRSVPFEVWDFAPRGPEVPVYVHYLSPSGHLRATVALGTTHGQCGTLTSPDRPLFPFTPGPGTWTLAFDTAAHAAQPSHGKVARLRIGVG